MTMINVTLSEVLSVFKTFFPFPFFFFFFCFWFDKITIKENNNHLVICYNWNKKENRKHGNNCIDTGRNKPKKKKKRKFQIYNIRAVNAATDSSLLSPSSQLSKQWQLHCLFATVDFVCWSTWVLYVYISVCVRVFIHVWLYFQHTKFSYEYSK